MAVRFQMRVAGVPGGAAVPPARVAGILGCVAFGVATLLYVLGALFWSGQRVANFDVRQGASFEVGGITISHTGATAKQVGPVVLDPAMNPARVVLHTAYRRLRAGQSLSVTVTMREPDGPALWTKTRRIASSPPGRTSAGSGSREVSNSSVLATFDVPRAGNYVFDVAVDSPSGDPVRRLGLELRREVANVRMAFVWAGIFAALACLLAGIFGGRSRDSAPQSGRLAA